MGLGRFSDTELILGVLAVFYVAEGIWWLRHGTVAFCRWLGMYRQLGFAPLVENAVGRLVLASPWPWSAVFLSDRWRFCLGQRGIRLTSPAREPQHASPGDSRFIPFDSSCKIDVDGQQLRINGQQIAMMSSPHRARTVADELTKIAQAPAAERQQAIDDWLGRSTDIAAAACQFESFRSASRSLKLTATVLFLYTFLAGPLLYYLAIETWGRIVLYYIVAFFCFWYVTVFNFYLAHYTLFPTRAKERRNRLWTMLLSPADAMRSTTILSRDLLVEYHPIVIAAVIFPRQRFVAYAQQVLRELRFPLNPRDQEGTAEGADIEDEFRENLIHNIEHIVTCADVTLDDLQAPPTALPDARTYCPRCLSQFVVDQGNCFRCSQMPLRAFQDGQRSDHRAAQSG